MLNERQVLLLVLKFKNCLLMTFIYLLNREEMEAWRTFKLVAHNFLETIDRDRLNASGGCEAAVTARVRIGWVRFRKCGELLLGNRFPLKMKGKVYCCCVRSAILYGSETWCLKENEKAILRRTERAMVRAMCGQKIVDRKTTEEQMDMLGLKETMDRLATANGVRWYGHVLRRDDDSVLRVALNLEVNWQEKARTTEENLEEASGRGDRESWFEEGGCSETR